jgi:3'-5' exoribonuclease
MDEQTTIEEQTMIEALVPQRVPLRELQDGQRVNGAYAVRGRELRRKRNGDPWLKLTLGDASGTVEAVAWEDAEALYALAARGACVFVAGTFEDSERWGPKIKLTALREAAAGEYDEADLATGSDVPIDRLEADLRQLLETIQSTPLRELLYIFFPGNDRDDADTGALLHDIGKTEAYNDDPRAIDLTDLGRLQGEIPLGYYVVRRRIEDIPGFVPSLAQAVLHIILSHHGSLEHGSPVVPCTREAVLVHMIDNLGGRLGSFDRLERELPAGDSWSSFDRALSGSAYFGRRDADDRRAA